VDLIEFSVFPSSLGNIILVARKGRLLNLDVSKAGYYEIRKRILARYPDAVESIEPFKTLRILLDRYLKGERVDFDVEVDLADLGDFARLVLLETRKIPHGEVRSYLAIGRKLGYGSAARAVGQALKRNPVPLVIPCHRVIREDGSIGGFSLEGVSKQDLLALEQANSFKRPQQARRSKKGATGAKQ